MATAEAFTVEHARALLATHGQEHLLSFYDQLSQEQKEQLVAQIQHTDFALLRTMYESVCNKQPTCAPPTDVRPLPADGEQGSVVRVTDACENAVRAGEEEIRRGHVACVMVAGGQGTRLGVRGPKGAVSCTPVTHKPLFQLFCEQILAATRRYGADIPLYIMTSRENDAQTNDFLRDHSYFGLSESNVRTFIQGTVPSLCVTDGHIVLASKGELAAYPDGHGGCFSALLSSGCLADMGKRGVLWLSYFHVDNPMVRCVDPRFIGLHVLGKAEYSLKVVTKRDPKEKIGTVCLAPAAVGSGTPCAVRAHVIEYIDLPPSLVQGEAANSLPWGSIGIHVFSCAFARRCAEEGRMPLHTAQKPVPCVDEKSGAASTVAAIKFERFVFDALPLAERWVVVETDRAEEFAPIKNKTGEDSLESSMKLQAARTRRWMDRLLRECCRDMSPVTVPDTLTIELSPLYACSFSELRSASASAAVAIRSAIGHAVSQGAFSSGHGGVGIYVDRTNV